MYLQPNIQPFNQPYQSHQVGDDQDNEEQTGKEEQETKEPEEGKCYKQNLLY